MVEHVIAGSDRLVHDVEPDFLAHTPEIDEGDCA
jgi:hypothetical protein